MGDSSECLLPKSDSNTVLANQFFGFCNGKIDTIRDYLSNYRDPSATFSADVRFNGETLSIIVPATEDEIRKIGTGAPAISCELDPLPTCSYCSPDDRAALYIQVYTQTKDILTGEVV